MKKIIAFEDKKRKDIDSAKQSEINNYHSVLVAYIKELKQARKEFNALKAFQLLNAARTKCGKTADDATSLLAYINNVEKDLKALRKNIDNTITPPEHEDLIYNADADIAHLEKIKISLDTLIKAFKDAIKKVVTDTELTSLQSKLKQINDNLETIIGTMSAQDKHLLSIEKSSEEGKKTATEEIKKTCADIIGYATATITALADLAGADIIGLLDHGLNSLKTAQDSFIAKKQPLVEDLKNLIEEINLLIGRYNQAMQKQIEQKEGVLELQKLAAAIEAERLKLLEVIYSGKQILRDLAAWFKRPLTKEELDKLGLAAKEEAAGKAYEKFPERTPEKESTEDWRASRAQVEARVRDRLKLIRDEEAAEHKKIKEAEAILNNAVAQVNYLLGILAKRTLVPGSIEEQVYKDLTEFIRQSKTLKAYLADFDVFEKKLVDSIIENYRLAFIGQEGRSSTKVQNILLAHVMKDLEALEKIVNLLKIDEEKIKEKAVPITAPKERTKERTVPITPPASA